MNKLEQMLVIKDIFLLQNIIHFAKAATFENPKPTFFAHYSVSKITFTIQKTRKVLKVYIRFNNSKLIVQRMFHKIL